MLSQTTAVHGEACSLLLSLTVHVNSSGYYIFVSNLIVSQPDILKGSHLKHIFIDRETLELE